MAAAHCKPAPYESGKPGKNTLFARQVPRRAASLACEGKGDRGVLYGGAVTFMPAEIVFEA
ncbi:phenazine biosynthesis PhzC/PhzF protein [Thiohalobacter thiocyanaticus]|uniref:Phenazine biosynthesis PhzC/PhzF protein n=1 Tax=Thiohalobacter thiocyanaticus TaxID=585455 RepID=A0A1Z4VTB7_9GAMM|nr:phenazine biosynthesis PhzC/PhzF protein [Thiohalobacter thiocyanaticus]